MHAEKTNTVENNAVTAWFGDAFFQLNPKLQSLHVKGGRLTGNVELSFGTGLAGIIGRRLAKKLGIPSRQGMHELLVEISHRENALHWSRCFDRQQNMLSIFKPVGKTPSGYWVEKTGPLSLKLTVDIIQGAWHWRLLGVRLFGLPLPVVLFPKSTACKKIVNGDYHFHVGFSMPWIGQLLCYEGKLALSDGARN